RHPPYPRRTHGLRGASGPPAARSLFLDRGTRFPGHSNLTSRREGALELIGSVGAIVERSVDEQRRRSAYAGAQPAREIFLDASPMATVGERRVELGEVEPGLIRVAAKVAQLERSLTLEEQVVHRPEAILGGGLLGGLGG